MGNRKPTWVVQDNLRQVNDGIDAYLDALTTLAIPYKLTKVVPFVDDVEPPGVDGPVIFLGSTSLRDRVVALKRYLPGVFYDPEDFSFDRLRTMYGAELLNADSRIYTVGDLLSKVKSGDLDPTAEVFLRPAGDGKEVNGGVKTLGDWVRELESSLGVHHGSTEATEVQVATPKVVTHEWRTWFVAGELVDGCQSRVDGKLNMAKGLPHTVWDYVQNVVDLCGDPAEVCVLDVGETIGENGVTTLKIIEPNCFNCAGLYAANPHTIVDHVTNYVQRFYE